MLSKKVNRKIKSTIICTCLLSLTIFTGASAQTSAQEAQSLDKIVAIADEGVVLKSELDQRVAQVMQQIRAQGQTNIPSTEEIRTQVLEQLIIESLQLQMANRAGIRVDDNMLNETIATIAQQNSLTFDQFRQALESQGAYLSTRRSIEKELTLGQLQRGAVNSRIEITRQEIENYLRSETGQSNIAPEYHVSHILIPNSEVVPAERRRELADLIYQRVLEGTDITALAQQGQIMGITVNGGDLGWRKPENLPSFFQPVVPNLSPGQVSEPFTSANGFHIVHLLETRGGVNLSVQQSHVRHILIEPNEIRNEDQSRELIELLYEQIQNGADFADIARQNTDDEASMVSGGDLEWVSEGQVPPDFLAIINDTEVGEMTEPFRIESGWHILEVLDRRQQDVTEENKRFRAQQELRNRKYEMELENWLTEIRDTAFVDIKEEVPQN